MSSGPCLRSVYLVTYSQATEDWSRETFSRAIVSTFEEHNCEVTRWVCAKENHQDGGIHFHLALKLDRQKRWLKIRNKISTVYDINVNFSDKHSNYFDAWEYTTKEDTEFIQSEDHPDLTAGFVPRTNAATNRRRSTSTPVDTNNTITERKRKFDALDLAEVIVTKKIKTKKELLALANIQRKEGKRDLALYVLNNLDKCVKIIPTAWEMERSREETERAQKSRMQILREASQTDCVATCAGEGKWLQLALETLSRNGFKVGEFSMAVQHLLKSGRGKHRNLILTGQSNCGKSFLLNPLNDVFNTFTNPAQNSFAWIGAERAEVIFLNDIRWSEKLIPWNNFLQLLEGSPVHLSVPKNHSPEDIKFTKDTPIFATSYCAH